MLTRALNLARLFPKVVAWVAVPYVIWMVAASVIALRAPDGSGLSSLRDQAPAGLVGSRFNPSRGELK